MAGHTAGGGSGNGIPAAIAAARRVVTGDSGEFHRTAFATVRPLDRIVMVVTGEGTPCEPYDARTAAGVTVRTVPAPAR